MHPHLRQPESVAVLSRERTGLRSQTKRQVGLYGIPVKMRVDVNKVPRGEEPLTAVTAA
jgi:hypothetical protein